MSVKIPKSEHPLLDGALERIYGYGIMAKC